MHLSISNSETKKWLMTWLIAAIMLLGVLCLYERYLRQNNFTPSVEVSKDLWSWNRMHSQKSEKVIALLGASRMQLGVDTVVMREQLPGFKVVPLAINGEYPMATFKALAEDEQFNGLVVMSFMAQMLEPQYEDMQLPYNQYFKESHTLSLSLDAYLTAYLQSKWAFLHPLLGLKDWVDTWSEKHRFPQPFYVSTHLDTSSSGDYSLVDVKQLKTFFVNEKRINYQQFPAMGKAVWKSQIKKINQYAQAIVQRGGRVALVRFPTDDEHWLLDEQYYPRESYWDTLVQGVQDILFIHFDDYEGLNGFELPDSSHLDQKDAKTFTVNLIQILKNSQFFN